MTGCLVSTALLELGAWAALAVQVHPSQLVSVPMGSLEEVEGAASLPPTGGRARLPGPGLRVPTMASTTLASSWSPHHRKGAWGWPAALSSEGDRE